MLGEPVAARTLADSAAHHLKYTLGKDTLAATAHDRFVAVCHAVRDKLVERWIETQRVYHRENGKRACYLSMEFLLGRLLSSNLHALGAFERARTELEQLGVQLHDLLEQEPDPALGNGGLGRLAACILEALATQRYPAVGYGLRYEFGLFRQRIQDGGQVEEPDHWLERGCPWELPRPEYTYPVQFGGRVVADRDMRFRWVDAHVVLGTAYDLPIAGHGVDTVNTLRLWAARATHAFDLEDFSKGDYAEAVEAKVGAENLTKVLYPDDRTSEGRELRLRQQYLLVSCTVQDVLRRHKAGNNPLSALPDKVTLQLNDTHPALAVVELLRLLLDGEGLDWAEAWDLTRRTVNYTNHTLMAEALEQWPVELFERLLPRHLQLVFEINRRHLEQVAARWPGDDARLQRMSLIGEHQGKRVRMAHLATVGSRVVNGVSAIHSRLLTERVLHDFAELEPEKFKNVTNGVTPRRWMLQANPGLSKLITDKLGDDRWVANLDLLKGLEEAAEDEAFRERFRAVKRANKAALSDIAARTAGLAFDPDALLDVQVKRLHEYKRQLLNILHVAHLHRRLREAPGLDLVPRTVLFGAKAAPAYWMAKRIIRLIHAVGAALEQDPVTRGRLRVVFMPDYRVTLAERIIPAAELSEQISTAGTEASGTGNMKLGLNGALTIGTFDGATVEMHEAVGAEHMFTFGLDAAQVAELHASGRNRGWEVYHEDADVRATVDFLCSGIYRTSVSDDLQALRDSILVRSDPYLTLADLPAYAAAQEQVDRRYRDQDAWARSAALNVARLGTFSIDRTVHDYAREVWNIAPVDVSLARKSTPTRLFQKKVVPGA
jgi:glycogen phosphorylase